MSRFKSFPATFFHHRRHDVVYTIDKKQVTSDENGLKSDKKWNSLVFIIPKLDWYRFLTAFGSVIRRLQQRDLLQPLFTAIQVSQ